MTNTKEIEELLREILYLIQKANSIKPKYAGIISDIKLAIKGESTNKPIGNLEAKIDLVLEKLNPKSKKIKKLYATAVSQKKPYEAERDQ